jgi:hypothetical protein
MRACKHQFKEQGIGAGLVRKVCVSCSMVHIAERPKLGFDPWRKAGELATLVG